MLAAMLAATMSSMDTGLNGSTGVIVNNIIPRLRERLGKAPLSDRTNIRLCRLSTVMLGVYIILIGLLLAFQKELALFDAYLMINAIIGLPLSMPILLAFWIKRLHWSAYFIIIGTALLPSAYFVLRSAVWGENWPIQDRLMWIYAFSLIGVVLSLPLWRRASAAYKEQVKNFYEKMHRPVDFIQEIGTSRDAAQYRILGWTTFILGSLILLFLFVPNELAARLQIAGLACAVLGIGGGLIFLGRRHT